MHKTRSVFERYNIVSECDFGEAAKELNTIQAIAPAKTVRLFQFSIWSFAIFDLLAD